MNEKLDSIAREILNKCEITIEEKKDEDNYGSVIIILMLISILLTSIRAIQECNKSKLLRFGESEKCEFVKKNIKDLSYKRGFFTKMKLKKIVKKNLNADLYSKYGQQIIYCLFNYGENVTDDEVQTLMEASNV